MGNKKANKKKSSRPKSLVKGQAAGAGAGAEAGFEDIDFNFDLDDKDEDEDEDEDEKGNEPPPSFDVLDSINDIDENDLIEKGNGGGRDRDRDRGRGVTKEKKGNNSLTEKTGTNSVTEDIMARYGINSSDSQSNPTESSVPVQKDSTKMSTMGADNDDINLDVTVPLNKEEPHQTIKSESSPPADKDAEKSKSKIKNESVHNMGNNSEEGNTVEAAKRAQEMNSSATDTQKSSQQPESIVELNKMQKKDDMKQPESNNDIFDGDKKKQVTRKLEDELEEEAGAGAGAGAEHTKKSQVTETKEDCQVQRKRGGDTEDVENYDQVASDKKVSGRKLEKKEDKDDDDDDGDLENDEFVEDQLELVLDNSWMTGLRNKELLQEAEILICRTMMADPNASDDPLWREVIDINPGETLRSSIASIRKSRMVSVRKFVELWKHRCGMILTGDVVSALLVRCGPAYQTLQSRITDIICPPDSVDGKTVSENQSSLLGSDCDAMLDKALNNYSAKKLSSIAYSMNAKDDEFSSHIDLNILKSMLLQYECLFNVWVMQISRIQPFLDEKARMSQANQHKSKTISRDKPNHLDLDELFDLTTKRLGMVALSKGQCGMFAQLVLASSIDGGAGDKTRDARDSLAELQVRCSRQCQTIASFSSQFQSHLRTFLVPKNRLVSYLDEDPITRSEELEDIQNSYPPSILSVFRGELSMGVTGKDDANNPPLFNISNKKHMKNKSNGAPVVASFKNVTLGTKVLCDYLIDCYDPDISGDFLCTCCYLWSMGNFNVFFNDDDGLPDGDMFVSHTSKNDKGSSDDNLQLRLQAEKSSEVVLRSSRGLSHPVPASKSSVILQETMMRFLYPFNITLKESSVLGKTIYRNKFHPLETTDQMINFLTNKFFLKFRKSYSSEKAPSDISIYKCNSEGVKAFKIQSSSMGSESLLVADICGDEDYVCLESPYVMEVCNKMKKQQLNKVGNDKKQQDNVENRRPPSNAKELVDRLAHPPPPIHIKAPKPFPFSYGSVHAWGIATMVKYVQQVMELPQYEEPFLQYELNGYSFICLDKEAAAKVCAATSRSGHMLEGDDTQNLGVAVTSSTGQVALHTAKMAFHADNLRNHAFQSALENIPVVLDEYHPIHIAALLNDSATDQGGKAPHCALHALRKQLSGEKLIRLKAQGIADTLSKFNCETEETNRSIQLLLDLLARHSDLKTLSVPAINNPQEGGDCGIDINKRKIHISTFDKKADAAEERKVNAMIKGKSGKKETAMAAKRRKEENMKITEKIKPAEKLEKIKEAKIDKETVDGSVPTSSLEKNESDISETELAAFREMNKRLQGVADSRMDDDDDDDDSDLEPEAQSEKYEAIADEVGDDGEGDVDDEVITEKGSETVQEVLQGALKSIIDATAVTTKNVTTGKKKKKEAKGKKQEKLVVGAAVGTAETKKLKMYEEQNNLFMEQMQSMQNVLKTHTDLVNTLKQQNIQLQNDNVEASKKVQMANQVAKAQEEEHEYKLQLALQQRNIATQSLSFVSGQYVNDMKGQIEHSNQSVPYHAHTDEVYIPKNKTSPSLTQQVSLQNDTSEQHTHQPHINNQLGASSSTFDEASSSHRPSSPSQFDQMINMHETPMRTARSTMVRSSARHVTNEDDDTYPDIVGQMARDAEYEIHQWRKLLKVYKFSQQPIDIGDYDDVNATIRRLAIVWCRLGKVMYDDCVGRGDADDTETTLTPLLQGLLVTVRKAVDIALQCDEGVMEGVMHESLGENSMTIDDQATRRQHDRLTFRRKKHTQRQIEKMTSNTEIHHSSLNVDSKRYSYYVGLVFALALVYKLINKFESKNEQVNLMYLLQRLRHGDDTCFKELSREDFRGFLGDHLYFIFDAKWHKFDALCQRFDPDKKGFINHSQLQKSFRWLCPLAQPIGDVFDSQVSTQALLSMVSLQILSSNLEMNTLFRKLLVEFKDIVPTFDSFISQKSKFPNCPPHDLRFNCDSLLIADFLFVLSSQYLGLEIDSTDFTSSINRNNTGKSWQFPHNLGTSSRKINASSHKSPQVPSFLLDDNRLWYGVKFTLLNLRSVCDTVTKGLLLYDYSKLSPMADDSNSGSVAFSGLYTLLSSYLAFWKQTATITPSASVDRQAGKDAHLVDKISDERQFVSSLTTLLGDDLNKVTKLLQQMESIRIDNIEVLISELIGTPIPAHSIDLPLVNVQANMHSQMEILQDFYNSQGTDKVDARNSSKKSLNFQTNYDFDTTLPPSPISNSPVLQRWDTKSAHRLATSSRGNAPIITENDDDNDGDDDYPSSNRYGSKIKDGKYSTRPTGMLTANQEDLQYQQRVSQVKAYAEDLQHKLDGRKNILKGLLHLLRSCQSPNRKKRPNSTYGGDDGAAEISVKLTNLQKRLLHEMQQKRSTRMELLEKHVNEWKRAFLPPDNVPSLNRNKGVSDDADSLVRCLQEVASIEADILQANSDALLIVDNISGILNRSTTR